MDNQEFQELKEQLASNPSDRISIVNKMRGNLISRNNGSEIYTLDNSGLPLNWNINYSDENQLSAINDDMNNHNI